MQYVRVVLKGIKSLSLGKALQKIKKKQENQFYFQNKRKTCKVFVYKIAEVY